MKKFIFALTFLGALNVQLVHASASCKHLYVGKKVSYSFIVQVGDFWLGYEPEKHYANAKVIGIGDGVASIEITKVYSGHSDAPKVGDLIELECSSLLP